PGLNPKSLASKQPSPEAWVDGSLQGFALRDNFEVSRSSKFETMRRPMARFKGEKSFLVRQRSPPKVIASCQWRFVKN
ncbi:MAG: hypothetical protein WBE62_02630, partial [Methylocella sp.]